MNNPHSLPRLMILTMQCGEQEFESCKQAVRVQDYQGKIEHVFIDNMGNRAAHKMLYDWIMDEAEARHYDLFLKLDADMVLTRTTALSEMVTAWQAHDQPDHMAFAVHDFIPNRLSMGVHLFSANCRWQTEDHDALFVDANPVAPKGTVKIWDQPAPFVIHAGDPSPEQAFHFGVHRTLKAFQPNRHWAQPQALEAFRILRSTVAHYQRTQDHRCALALRGAEAVRLGVITLASDDRNGVRLHEDLNIDFWTSNASLSWLYWFKRTGWRTIPFFIRHKYKRMVARCRS